MVRYAVDGWRFVALGAVILSGPGASTRSLERAVVARSSSPRRTYLDSWNHAVLHSPSS